MPSQNNNRTIYEIVGAVVALILLGLFFVIGRGGANAVIDNAQATAAALQNTVNELLDAPQSPDLSGDLAAAEAELATAQTEVALLQASTPVVIQPTDIPATAAPTAIPHTATPEPPCFPSDLDEVVVIRDPRLNLWYSLGNNGAGRPIMAIFEDDDGNRIQYSIGVTFFVYEEPILADGGALYYEVFGPLGMGKFVQEAHIKLFDADPELFYCTE